MRRIVLALVLMLALSSLAGALGLVPRLPVGEMITVSMVPLLFLEIGSMASSVVGSSALVASSSTRIVGFPTSDRAISSRCRCPPEKFPPPSSTSDW